MKELKPESSIDLSIRVETQDMEALLNALIPDSMQTSTRTRSGIKLDVDMIIDGRITTRFDSNEIHWDMPLQYRLSVPFLGRRIEARGNLIAQFQTKLQLWTNWKMESTTTLVEHQWKEKPEFDLIGIDIKSQWIADEVIRLTRSKIGTMVDDIIQDQLGVEAYAQELWKLLSRPYDVLSDPTWWIQLHPQRVSMRKVQVEDNRLVASSALLLHPEIYFNQPDSTPIDSVPDIQWDASIGSQKSRISIRYFMSEAQMNDAFKQVLIGRKFESGKKHIVIDSVETEIQDDEVLGTLHYSGTDRGQILVTGWPRFMSDRQRIVIDDLKLKVKSEKAAIRAIAWIMKPAMRKQIRNTINLPFSSGIPQVNDRIKEILKGTALGQGVILHGSFEGTEVRNIFLTPEGLYVDVFAEGDLTLKYEHEKP